MYLFNCQMVISCNGNIYKPEGLVSRNYSETAKSLFFAPSVYFDNSHKKLYFGFDGIVIGAEEGKSFKISLNDTYPKTVSYMGEDVVIEKVTYDTNRNEPLQVNIRVPKTLRIEGIKIEGAHLSSRSHTDALDENGKPFPDVCGVEIEYRPEYNVEFEFPGHVINLPREIPIDLK